MKTIVTLLLVWQFSANAALSQNPNAIDIGPSKEVLAKATRATVVVRTSATSLGSGFLINTNGMLLTNYHVIEGRSNARIEFSDGRTTPVLSVLMYSPKLDLALLKIRPGDYDYLELENPDNIALGDQLFIIGHPHGHTWTLTKGYLAGKRTERGVPIIQFSADISPGNSGGPVMNMDGKVVGIATYIERRKIEFRDGVYILDPSSVLKFGVAVDAFKRAPAMIPRQEYTLNQIAAYNSQLVSIDIAAAVLDISHDLLKELYAGIRDLKVHVNRSYDYTYRDISGNYRQTGSETIVYNAARFRESAARLRALAHFLNQYVDSNTGDHRIDGAVRHWRDSMNSALSSINHVIAADGDTERNATRRVGVVRSEFNKSTKSMYYALEAAEQALSVYGINLPDSLVSPARISGLKRFYFSNGLSF